MEGAVRATANADATGSDPDLSPLRPFWHPVAYSSELAEKPISVTVLGEPVVVYRGDESVRAFRDLCPHRGAKISMGRLHEGRLVCPYHGFQYDESGRCRLIPSQAPESQVIPSRLRLHPYRAAERYGIVWVALEDPVQPLPALPEFDDPAFHCYSPGAVSWRTSAARWMENFLDITHFAHVHPGILADPEQPVCEPYEVEQTATGLRYEFDALQQLNPLRWPGDGDAAVDVEPTHVRHDLYLPFALSIATETAQGTWSVFSAGLPVSRAEVKIFFVQARDYMLDQPDDAATEVLYAIAEQDRPISENQHPEMLPVDLTEEVHLRVGDAVGVAYRRALREIGLTYA